MAWAEIDEAGNPTGGTFARPQPDNPGVAWIDDDDARLIAAIATRVAERDAALQAAAGPSPGVQAVETLLGQLRAANLITDQQRAAVMAALPAPEGTS